MASWTTTGDAHDQRFTIHHIDAGVASEARNALQVVSEALDIQNEHEQQQQQKQIQPQNLASASDQDEVEQQLKTIVASDSDVSNGFVKCGRSLPYVFEATETGT